MNLNILFTTSLSELIKGDLNEFLEIEPRLKNSKKKTYTVRSLYLDSPSKDHFYEKIDGIKTRKKYRFRTYSSQLRATDTFFLEQKGKLNERTFKKRIPFDVSELDHFLIDGGTNWLVDNASNDRFLQEYLYDLIRLRLKPAVVVEYQRQPFISDYDSYFRVTFDSQLTCFPSQRLFLASEDHIECLPGYTIIELKFFRRIPLWFHRIIQSRELRRVSVSKFVLGMKQSGLAVDLS